MTTTSHEQLFIGLNAISDSIRFNDCLMLEGSNQLSQAGVDALRSAVSDLGHHLEASMEITFTINAANNVFTSLLQANAVLIGPEVSTLPDDNDTIFAVRGKLAAIELAMRQVFYPFGTFLPGGADAS